MHSKGRPHGPRYVVTWAVSPLYRLEITSSLISGFVTMSQKGDLDLRIQESEGPPDGPHLMRLTIQEVNSGLQRTIAFDEFDRNDLFDVGALRGVEVYFKRNYSREAAQALPEGLRPRIHPAGVTFGCYTGGSRRLMGRAALAAFRAHLRSSGFRGLQSAVSFLGHNAAQLEGLLHQSEYERTDSDPLYDKVVYQTRIWPDEPDPTIDRRTINKDRLDLVLALRGEFGTHDQIGLLRTGYARRTAKEALLDRKVGRAEYALQLRRSLIAVNSHGLDGSGGFKIGESLAAGCALVSQPFRFELPAPFLPDVHFLPFETPDECVAQCRRLLGDRALAFRLRDAGRNYYYRNVEPEAHARLLLTRVFGLSDTSSSSTSARLPAT